MLFYVDTYITELPGPAPFRKRYNQLIRVSFLGHTGRSPDVVPRRETLGRPRGVDITPPKALDLSQRPTLNSRNVV